MKKSHDPRDSLLERFPFQDYTVAACSMRGRRADFEDTFKIKQIKLGNGRKIGVIALFDGHGGRAASDYLQEHFCSRLKEALMEKDGAALKNDETLQAACTNVCRDLDSGLSGKASFELCGSTGIFALVMESGLRCGGCGTEVTPPEANSPCQCDFLARWESWMSVVIGNIGDSRGYILAQNNIIRLTSDHNAKNPKELKRIEETGVDYSGDRVMGLGVSRAFGDNACKNVAGFPPEKQPVICDPEFTFVCLEENEYLLLCCDGVVESLSDQALGRLMADDLKYRRKSSSKIDLAMTAYALCSEAYEKGSGDNMTAIVMRATGQEGTSFSGLDTNWLHFPYSTRITVRDGKVTTPTFPNDEEEERPRTGSI